MDSSTASSSRAATAVQGGPALGGPTGPLGGSEVRAELDVTGEKVFRTFIILENVESWQYLYRHFIGTGKGTAAFNNKL